MKLDNFKRIITEDVDKQYRPLVEKIGYSINSFAEQVIEAFNGKITVEDNLNAFYKDVSVQVDTRGVPSGTVAFKSSLATLCKGLTVIKVDNTTNSNALLTGAPFILFSENNKIITIKQITGLISGNKYNLTVKAEG